MRVADISGSSIVVVGDINPAIFSPDWLEFNSLIGPDDSTAAKASPNYVVSRQATIYETEWFSIQVLDNQLSITSNGALSLAFKDLAVGILSLVTHTPITAIGLNFFAHYKLANQAEHHKVGDVLAPKAIWNKLYPEKNEVAGLHNLTIGFPDADTRGENQAKTGDIIRISLFPSSKLSYGVHFLINNHLEISHRLTQGVTAAEVSVALIEEHWENYWKDSSRVFDTILNESLA